MNVDKYMKENGWWLNADDGDEPDFGEEHDVGLVTEEAEPELKRPPMYKVIWSMMTTRRWNSSSIFWKYFLA